MVTTKVADYAVVRVPQADLPKVRDGWVADTAFSQRLRAVDSVSPMHPLPSEQQLDWLRGDRLDVVGTAEFTMYFSFDSGGVLQTTEPVTLTKPGAPPATYEPETRAGTWGFQEVIGGTVLDLRLVDEMTLELAFASGRLLIRSNAGPYEAGRIGFPDGTEAFF